MKKIISFSVVFLLLVSACKKKKDLPEPEVSSPYFYLNCNMDGQPLNIVAGNDNYYMNSSWYHQDTQNVYVYKANLAKQGASGYQVTILFNDTKLTSPSDPMRVDSSLIVGDRMYNDQIINGTTQTLKFTPIKSFAGIDSYTWSYTDGINTWGPNGGSGSSNYNYSASLDVNKTYSVTLNYAAGDGTCGEKFTNVFQVGSKMQTEISATKLSSTEYKYQFSYSPVSPIYKNLKCQWQMLSGGTYTDSTPIKIYQPNFKDLIKLTLTDYDTGDFCTSYYQFNATTGNVCDANYHTDFEPIKNTNIPSSVTILLTDPNGVVYSSKALVQPTSSNFQITEVMDYKNNEKNQPTKSLKVKFNCVVKNGSTEINLKDGEAKVAVAYK